jgi:uncharacterized phage protein (TIGR01671 family)
MCNEKQREIRFRGKRVDNGEWAEGYYIEAHYHWHNHGVHKEWIVSAACANGGWFTIYGRNPVIAGTVGQYTGLTDKNGKKIFEGDILSIARRMDGMGTYYFPAIEYPVNVVVKWDMCSWMWETIAEDTRYISFPDAWCHYECEVIGNIHDTPELLEEAQHAE